MTFRHAAAWFALACLAACGGSQHSQLLHPTRETGVLVPPRQIVADFVWRQRIAVRFKARRDSFSAVIEKRADRLLLLGLTPFGTRAFALEQRGTTVTFTPYIELELPFSPLYVLADVHRAFFRGLPNAPLPDGWHEQSANGEQIRERWQGGRLFERGFRSLDASGNGVLIRYEGGMLQLAPPRTISLISQHFGYALTITTLFAQSLGSTAR